MDRIYENAINSIKMGIEDYASEIPTRALSAVRNFYAGVLLLGKDVLIRAAPLADPNEIIGVRYVPKLDGKGGILYESEGGRTVDFYEIIKRFKDFNIPISMESIRELNALRNHIEHRYTDKPAQVVREVIARAFPVVVSMFQYVGEHPAEVLGEAWPIMLRVNELYKMELERCRATLSDVKWISDTVSKTHLRCMECSSDLIEQLDGANVDQNRLRLVCRSCNAEPDWEGAITDAIDRALADEVYYRLKEEGRVGPIYDCPACGRSAYIDFENGCAVCGEVFDYESKCWRCHSHIPLEEGLLGLDRGLCSYCAHIMEKDD